MSSIDGSSMLADPAVGALPSFVVTVGPHCEAPELRQLAKSLCVGLCAAGFHAVDVSNNRASSTTYTTAFPDSDLTTLYGMSQADLRSLSKRLKEKTEIFVPFIDLSMFTFEESLYVLYYALRHACLGGCPVVLPIVDATFMRVASALSRGWGADGAHQDAQSAPTRLNTSTHHGIDMSESQRRYAEGTAKYLRGSYVEEAIRAVLPWLFQSSFFLVTDLSVSEMTTRLVNFGTDLVQRADGGPADEALGQLLSETVWDSYRRAFATFSDKRPNSIVSKILTKLSAGGAVSCNALRELDLNNCMMGDAGVQALAVVLRKLPCVVTLSCSGNNIRDPGCHALAAHIGDHPSLEVLNISDNKITDAGITSLYFMLEGSSGVLSVDFSNNLNTSKVWVTRTNQMLARNRSLSLAQAAASGVLPLKSKRNQTIGNSMKAASGVPEGESPSSMTLTLRAKAADDGTVGGVEVACRLDGFAAQRASTIVGGARQLSQGNLEQQQQRPSLELEFMLEDALPSAAPVRSQSWSSQLLLQAGVVASAAYGPSTMLINLTRLNGQKLPVLYNAQRLDALCDDDGAERPTTKTLRSWADVASVLLTTSCDERRTMFEQPSTKQLASWSPPPSYEVLLLLTLDVLVNTQRNIFATALRSLLKTQPMLGVELRVVFEGNSIATTADGEGNVGGSESATELMKASLVRPAVTGSTVSAAPSPIVRESFFTDTSFLVLLKLRDVVQPSGGAATAGRLNRPNLTGDVISHVVGSSSTQYYRPLITRCAGNVSSEITALLRWMLKQTNDPESYEHLLQGERDDQANVDAHESALKVRITTKWSTGA